MPMSVLSGHRFASPARHRRHVPSEESGFTATVRPTRFSFTPSPTSTTVPANSWPITSGGVLLPIFPRYPPTSEPQIPTASGRRTTIPACSSGSGTSSTDISSGPCHTTAFIRCLLLPLSPVAPPILSVVASDDPYGPEHDAGGGTLYLVD